MKSIASTGVKSISMIKYIFKYCLFILIFIPSLTSGREIVKFNQNWKFILGNPISAHKVNFDDSGWKDVQIPHDWAIEGQFDAQLPANTGKLPWKGVGWYRKNFDLDSNNIQKQFYFIFDGIMAFPEVYINGRLAGRWDYGYNSFYLNVTGLLRFDSANLIAIKADTRAHDSRWYPGAGIYRNIKMMSVNPVHFSLWDTQIQTPIVHDDSALIHVYTSVNNKMRTSKNIIIQSYVINQDGDILASSIKEGTVAGRSHGKLDYWLTLKNPKRWDIKSPNLYRLKCILKSQGKIVDSLITSFGVRSFRFTADEGFWLNGRRVQLKGVNLHHDHGPLGAKFYKSALERQLLIMKEMGVNAIRNSHNVAAPELLSLCDSLGLLLYNEAFDKWDAKADYLPGMDFNAFAERNISNWVRRDRNHPCVILWSVGNEMGDIQYNIDGGFDKLNTMISLVRKYDPTRPVNMVCDAKGSAKWRHSDYYDVHAWNYGRRYLPARNIDPSKSVIISESASTLSSRGFYELPLPEKKTDFTQSLQVSSYDLNAPYWAEVADDDFMWQEADTYVAGEFVWTGFDYLGEPTPYNDEAVKDGFIRYDQSAKSSYFGIVDLCGIPKDRYYLYKSYWKPEENTNHILPHWNWAESEFKKIPVFVYTNGECAELFLNNKSLGKKCKKPDSENSVERYRLMWADVEYEAGELKAVTYKNGLETSSAIRRTSGVPHRIALSPEKSILRSNGEDLTYVLVEAFDKNGYPCPLAENLINFEIKGPAVIEGVGNGNPQSLEPFIARQRKLFYGKAMVIIKSNRDSGKIKLKATGEGLKKAQVELLSQ